MKHIRMIIRPDGTCTIDAVDFTDASCTQATQQITAALGGGVVRTELKPAARLRQTHGPQPTKVAR